MNLIILLKNDFIDHNRCRIADGRAKHIRKILRCQTGDSVEVGRINGPTGTGKIEKIDATEIILKCEFKKENPPPYPVDIICALPRPQTLKKVLITVASMGIRRLHLIRANRMEKSYFHSPLLKEENYSRFLIEGLSQGKLTRMPEVTIHHRFKPFFEDFLPSIEEEEGTDSLKLLPHPECRSDLRDVFQQGVSQTVLAIGPEGGWVPFEVELMEQAGFKPFNLGPWILKVETALAAAAGQIELVKQLP
jgi:RsmE family RNA methyltransferase